MLPAKSATETDLGTNTVRCAQRRAGNIPRRILQAPGVGVARRRSAQRRAGNIPRRILPHSQFLSGRRVRSTKGGKYSPPNPKFWRTFRTTARTLNEGREIFPAESSNAKLSDAQLDGAAQRRAGNIPRRIRASCGMLRLRLAPLNEGREIFPAESLRAALIDATTTPLNEGREIFPAESVTISNAGVMMACAQRRAGNIPRRIRRHCGPQRGPGDQRSTKGGKYSPPNLRCSSFDAPMDSIAQRRAGNIPRRIRAGDDRAALARQRSTKGGKYSPPNLLWLRVRRGERQRSTKGGKYSPPNPHKTVCA